MLTSIVFENPKFKSNNILQHQDIVKLRVSEQSGDVVLAITSYVNYSTRHMDHVVGEQGLGTLKLFIYTSKYTSVLNIILLSIVVKL